MTADEILATIPSPDPRTEARAAEFQRLTPDERWRQLAAMTEAGWWLVRSSPDRAAVERQMAACGAKWREFQQQAFAAHAE